MRYFKTDDLELVTMDRIKLDYADLKASGDLADYEDFNSYLSACQSYNNGILTEISEDDAKQITVDTVYYTDGKYGEIQHTGKHYYDYIFRLKATVDNAANVKWQGVNGVYINEDSNCIFQASGYTHDRGLFCDLY